MAITTEAVHPLDDPNNRCLQLEVGNCYVSFPCVSVGAYSESEVYTQVNSICSAPGGGIRLTSHNEPTIPARQPVPTNMDASTFESLRELFELSRRLGQSCVPARIAITCGKNSDGTDKIYAIEELPDFQLGKPRTFAPVNKLGEGGGLKNRISIANDYSGLVNYYNFDNLHVQSFENETGQTLTALYQCGDAICESGTDACGTAVEARGICDRWLWWANDGVNNFLYETTDGGEDYDTANPIATLLIATYGTIFYADCDGNIYSDSGVIRLCGSDYELNPALIFPNTPVTGTEDIILFGNTGIYSKSARTGNWVVTNANNAAHPAMTVIDRDGDLVVAAGTNDGVAVGAYFMYSLDGGSTWDEGNVFSVAGWSVIGADDIQAVNVTGSTVTFVITNGTDTRVYSTDNISATAPDFALSYGVAGTVAVNVQLYRPTTSITYLVLDCELLMNKSGLCDCQWESVLTTADCLGAWAVCENDPLNLHRVYTV